MLKIMHTADIHLNEEKEERWEALSEIVRLGKEEEIDVLVISGDLFNQDVDAELLRPRLREVLGGVDFETLILPGNHDSSCYRDGLFFGEHVHVMYKFDEPVEIEGVMFRGMPFELLGSEEIAARLRTLKREHGNEKTQILLYHGELLDSFFSRQELGDEGNERYMPLKLSYFKDVNIKYVLAGHFHSRFAVWELENGGYFVYPGSPVSVTRRETGPRKVNIFKVGEQPCEFTLETLHYEELNIVLDPFDNGNPLDIIGRYFENLHPRIKVILSVKGFINGEKSGLDEQTLVREIKSIAESRCAGEINFEFRDISRILESDLFRVFLERLENSDFPRDKKIQVRDMTIRAMMGVSS